MGIRLGLLGLALTLFSGCTASRALCPAEGGRPWREVRSTHFRVRTNLEEQAAAKSAVELEEFRRALLLAWGAGFDPPGTVDVIVLSNPRDLEEFTDARYAGFAGQTPDGPRMVMTGGGGYLLADTTGDKETQAHELAHYLSAYALLRQPRWVSEGLASYLQTITIRPSDRNVVLGRASPALLQYVRAHGWLTLDELWQWDGKTNQSTAELQLHYASSWLWVHYLINEHGDRFSAFQAQLARGEDPQRAFAAAFQGDTSYPAALANYVRLGRYAISTQPLPPVPTQTQTRALEPADVHVIRALLFTQTPGDVPREERQRKAALELEQALKEDPTHVETQRMQAETLDKAERLKLARVLVEQHPEDGRAWDLLATALQAEGDMSATQEQARQRAAKLLPDSPSAQNGLAWYYVLTEQPQKGLAPARRALWLMPGDPIILNTQTALLFQTGRCNEAVAMGRRTLDMFRDGFSDEIRQTFKRIYATQEANCVPASTASSTQSN
ncbi:DUF1570 domain-containing protein [Corallococcus sp. AB030]|uniref:DUF1570 domain-containing protein n=1 Tax=Corallococcus TaxID=83461 RepID=UPI000EA190B0|nr:MULTISPECIES: DUF1570 domain-containing protein [Corallococcus]RKH22729.1 DUF1570 domain-containing protein [Corallococcus sp. CA041A]RKI19752.1 DUF1570 domain-containing protein [Corallococcus sp. AB030]